MIFVQLKQVFSCERVEYVGRHVMDRTEDHHQETAIPCFKPKGLSHPAQHRNSSVRDNILANNLLSIATSAIRNVTYLLCLTIFAPILISFTRRLRSGQCFIFHGRTKRPVRCHICTMKFKLDTSIKTNFHTFTLRVTKIC